MANNQYWERLEAVIRWTNMSANSFGRHIGLTRSESLYQIKAGRFGISHNLARRITECFPDISMGWLLTGEGQMLSEGTPSQTIPYYDQDVAACKAMGSELLRPTSMVNMPMLEACDCAFRSFDNAINRDISVGSIVFLKKTDTKAIIPGRFYVIVTPNYVLLRKIRFSGGKEGEGSEGGEHRHLLLETSNNDDCVKLNPSEVTTIFRVVANLKIQ